MTSCIHVCVHHVYKNVSMPKLGDELECRRGANVFDQQAVAVLRRGIVVKILPRLLLISTYVMALMYLLVDFLELLCR